jgi:hypothetical protein
MPQRTREPGEVFLDAHRNGRAMRLTWHHEADVVVLSLWRDHVCAGTFRLATDDVNDFVDALVEGLRGEPGLSVSRSAERGIARRVAAARQALPPRQRQGGLHAARTVDRPSVDDSGEGFSDWAFGGQGAHRATAT